MSGQRGHSGLAGGFFGVVVFLAGIAMLVYTFKLASDIFLTDPSVYFKTAPKQPLDAGKLQDAALGLVVRIVTLFVMAIVGGMISNRGIRLYTDSRGAHPPVEKKGA